MHPEVHCQIATSAWDLNELIFVTKLSHFFAKEPQCKNSPIHISWVQYLLWIRCWDWGKSGCKLCTIHGAITDHNTFLNLSISELLPPVLWLPPVGLTAVIHLSGDTQFFTLAYNFLPMGTLTDYSAPPGSAPWTWRPIYIVAKPCSYNLRVCHVMPHFFSVTTPARWFISQSEFDIFGLITFEKSGRAKILNHFISLLS